MKFRTVLTTLAVLFLGFDGSLTSRCGYNSCHPTKDGVLNVHLIPHSHDDVGWLKTVDQYYYGSRISTYRAGVQYIIDSVVKELLWNPDRRFIQVETAFFWRWYKNIKDETLKHQVKELINSGRLEIAGGGWSMNDEATTHYSAIIDNHAFGLNYLRKEFGECSIPRAAWQIDPFGHSREQANLFAMMGYDSVYFARIDYRDKNQRKKSKKLQMIWKTTAPSESPNPDSSIFAGAFDDHYSTPSGFCFDIVCQDEPLNDDPDLEDYNLDSKIKDFVDFAKSKAENYNQQHHLLVTMGDDFHYQAAGQNYINMDKLIKAVNSKTSEHGVYVLYSTPSCFTKSLNEISSQEILWPTKIDDFFPYASSLNAYWTGYFTSRPSLKRMERWTNSLSHSAKRIDAFKPNVKKDRLFVLKRVMAVAQHHDAVTGTERQDVANDYAMRLFDGIIDGQKSIRSDILGNMGLEQDLIDKSVLCPLLNVSSCHVSEESTKFSITIFNPLSRPINKYFRIPISKDVTKATIYDQDGEEVTNEIHDIPKVVINIPGRNKDQITKEILFRALDLPAIGYKSFFVVLSKDSSSQQYNYLKDSSDFSKTVDKTFNIKSLYYLSEFRGQKSGTYIFRPASPVKLPTGFQDHKSIISSDMVNEVLHVKSDWSSYVVRQYYGEPHIEIEWLIGPIQNSDHVGKEIVMEYSVKDDFINTNNEFYTDANGRQNVKRRIDTRYSFDMDFNAEKISSNYYPITAGIYTKDDENGKILSILNDRSQGGTSMNNGTIEVMVHRRCLLDDGYGMGEALNEYQFGTGLVARGKHYLLYSRDSVESSIWRRFTQQELFLEPTLVFTPFPNSFTLDQWKGYENKYYSYLGVELPDNVHILSLERWDINQLLLRLEHIFQSGEDEKVQSKPVRVDLDPDNFFNNLKIVEIVEMTLGGNQKLSDLKRLKWKTEDVFSENDINYNNSENLFDDENNIVLQPMQIRTFLLTVK